MPIAAAKTPTLADARWKRPVPLSPSGLSFIGVPFVR
jgi:hypothetical protein